MVKFKDRKFKVKNDKRVVWYWLENGWLEFQCLHNELRVGLLSKKVLSSPLAIRIID